MKKIAFKKLERSVRFMIKTTQLKNFLVEFLIFILIAHTFLFPISLALAEETATSSDSSSSQEETKKEDKDSQKEEDKKEEDKKDTDATQDKKTDDTQKEPEQTQKADDSPQNNESPKDTTQSPDTSNNTLNTSDTSGSSNNSPANSTSDASVTNTPSEGTSQVQNLEGATQDEKCPNDSEEQSTDENNASDENISREDTDCHSSSDNTTVNNDNNAGMDNNVGNDNNSGDNTVINTGGDATQGVDSTINTGDSASQTNIYNDANTNVVGENGQVLLVNIDGQDNQDVDLVGQFEDIQENASDKKPSENLEVNNNNDATVNNNVTDTANTGDNNIAGTSANTAGDNSIQTGDAISSVNIVNFLNKNIVGSNWLLAIINIFGSWTGNLIVPGEGVIETQDSPGYSDVNVTNNNNAAIDNNVSTTLNTGENSATNSNATIQTGDSYSETNVKTIANTNIVKNNWFLLLINNMGTWTGEVLNWNSETNSYDTLYSYDFESNPGDNTENNGTLTVNNNNNASINNNVAVDANTGNNVIVGGGSANITTGRAVALTNILNFVNTNIVGNNWLFGIVNVMGNWKGDVVFGYPDVAVVINANKREAKKKDTLNYQVSVENLGQAKADDVSLMVSLDPDLSYVSNDSNLPASENGDNLIFNLSSLAKGETRSFTISAKVKDDDKKELTSAAGVRTITKEINLGNNSSQYNTSLKKDTDNTIRLVDSKNDYGLAITRKSDIPETVYPGSIIKHSIIIANTGKETIHDAQLEDVLNDSSGQEIGKYSWPLGDITKNDILVMQYSLQINQDVSPGKYSFNAQASGKKDDGDKIKSDHSGADMTISLAKTSAQVKGEETNNPNEDIIPTASAAGVEDTFSRKPTDIPNWLWLNSLLAYFLLVNWALYPEKKRLSPIYNTLRQKSLLKLITIPLLATLATLGLWSHWSWKSNYWFLLSVLIILFGSYLAYFIKEKSRFPILPD